MSALAQKPKGRWAILFGSYTRGRADLLTDPDNLIAVDSDADV